MLEFWDPSYWLLLQNASIEVLETPMQATGPFSPMLLFFFKEETNLLLKRDFF